MKVYYYRNRSWANNVYNKTILNSKDIDRLSKMIQVLRLKSMQYFYKIKHVPGKSNNLVDLL